MTCGVCGSEISEESGACTICASTSPSTPLDSDHSELGMKSKRLGWYRLAAFASILSMAVVAVVTVPMLLNLRGASETEPVSSPTSTVPSDFAPAGAKLATQSPTPGDCWQSSKFENLLREDFYESGVKVPCTKRHDTVTFFVGNVSVDTRLNYESNGDLSGYQSNDLAHKSIAAVCQDAFENEFSTTSTRLNWLYFIPDPFAWAAGARWVRCDVYASNWGSTVGQPVAAKVLSDLDQIRAHFQANDYQICIQLGGSGIPLEYDSTFVDCAGSWDMKLISQQPLSGNGSEYPGIESVSAEAKQICDSFGQGLESFYPTKSGWDNGNTHVSCWLRG